MRRPTFTAKKVEGRRSPWRVYIPPTLSPNGRPANVWGKSKEAAEGRAYEYMAARKSHGDLIASITPHQLAEAVKALELLQPAGIGLLEAVNTFLADRAARMSARSFGAVFEAYESMPGKKSRSHVENVRHTKEKMRHLFNLPVTDLTAANIEAALVDCSRTTRDKRISLLRTILGHAVRKDWTRVNVALQLDTHPTERKEVETYEVEEVQQILDYALANDNAWLPYLALCVFCGLRPEEEATKLDWSDVHLDGKPEVVISAEISKTAQRRFVPIPDNCIAWIRASGVKLEGRVFPFSETTMNRKRQKMKEDTAKAGKPGLRFLKDGFRHTFCSAWLAHHKNVDRLREISGHTDTKSLFRHYNRAMREEDAVKFWAIVPNG